MGKEDAGAPVRTWPVSPVRTSWDDLLDGVATPGDWAAKRSAVEKRFHALLRSEAAPEPPRDPEVKVEREWDGGGFRISYLSYLVEAGERAHAYLAVPDGPVPEGGFPGVVCLHGTTNWGARRTLGLPPEPGDPHGQKVLRGLDYARQLVRRGYVTISPEHFCAARRMPAAGPFETADFYRRHPGWTAPGKYVHDSRIACSVLADRPEVDAGRLGVTGHSLGAQGSFWLAACDELIRCAAPSCGGVFFRENPNPLQWSRDRWYVYFPRLREVFLAGGRVACDLHEMMSLIAPRPLLNCFALNDGPRESKAHLLTLHLKIRELYRLLDAEPAHAFLVFGDGHAIPDLSRAAILSWFDRWLKHGGDPLGGWDGRPTPTG